MLPARLTMRLIPMDAVQTIPQDFLRRSRRFGFVFRDKIDMSALDTAANTRKQEAARRKGIIQSCADTPSQKQPHRFRPGPLALSATRRFQCSSSLSTSQKNKSYLSNPFASNASRLTPTPPPMLPPPPVAAMVSSPPDEDANQVSNPNGALRRHASSVPGVSMSGNSTILPIDVSEINRPGSSTHAPLDSLPHHARSRALESLRFPRDFRDLRIQQPALHILKKLNRRRTQEVR